MASTNSEKLKWDLINKNNNKKFLSSLEDLNENKHVKKALSLNAV